MPFFFNTSTPSTYVLILFGSRPCIAKLHHTFLPSLPKVFKMRRRYTCARLSRSHRTLTRSLLHAAVAPHPHTVAPARRKPNQGNAPSLTRAVACEQTKLSLPTADTYFSFIEYVYPTACWGVSVRPVRWSVGEEEEVRKKG